MKVSRLNSIEQYVISRETVSIDELCEVFGVSKNTIRRDLNELEMRGHVTKVYGGVTATVPSGAVPTPIRSGLHPVDKSTIGRMAAEEIEDGDTIFIDSGTTTLCLLRFLAAKKRITIITHSLGALSEASRYDNLNIISLGGIYSPTTDSFVGLSTIEALSAMRINKAFMGATGVSLTAGMTNTTFLEAEIKRAVVQRADSIYGMADSSKIDKQAIVTFCHLKDLTGFITDREPPAEYVAFCQQEGVRLRFEQDPPEPADG
ncbi:MAG: DeoR/GlpR family DNA-binding transcription regulator [Eubacteriales bacterium]|nr:DeoR/GlpR family DNA-binding transcription regulator [Eubacteriales bacterium]